MFVSKAIVFGSIWDDEEISLFSVSKWLRMENLPTYTDTVWVFVLQIYTVKERRGV